MEATRLVDTPRCPMPVGATGDVYRRGVDEVVLPLVERFDPTWLLLSAGFDAHRADPLTSLVRLSSFGAASFCASTADFVASAAATVVVATSVLVSRALVTVDAARSRTFPPAWRAR